MKYRPLLLVLISIFMQISLFSDSYKLYFTSSEGLYFKDSTLLTATAKIQGGWYKIRLNGSTGERWGVFFSGEHKTSKKKERVYESGTYHAYLYKEKIGWSWGNHVKHETLKLIKDSTAPNITTTASTRSWTNGNVTISAVASDSESGVKSIQYSTDNISYSKGSSITVTKNKTVYFKSIDNVGNSRTVSYNVSNIDKTTPSFSLFSDTTAFTNSDITIGLNNISTVSGVKRCQFQNDNGKWIDTNIKIVAKNGTVYCRIQNGAGTWSKTVSKKITNIDKTPPEIDFKISPKSWTKGSVKITPIGIDNESGIKSIKVKNPSGLYTPIESIDLSNNQTLEFSITNNAGLVSYIEYNITNIDKTPPIINPSVTPIGWSSLSKVITSNGLDQESGIKSILYSFDNISWFNGDSVEVSENGNIYFKIENGAGEWVSTSYYVDGIDKSPPNINLLVTPLGWTNASKSVEADVMDQESGILETLYSLDNINWTKGDTLSITDNNPVYFKTKNSAGLWSNSEIVIDKIDKTKPILKIVPSIPNDIWSNDNILLTAISSDLESNIKSTKYSLDNTNWVTGSSISLKDNGAVYFRTENNAGSIEEQIYNIENIDKSPPTLSFSSSPSTLTNQDVLITAIGIDLESGIEDVMYKELDGSWVSSNSKILTNNGYVTFKVLNRAGSYSEPYTFYVDYIDKDLPIIQNPFNNENLYVKDKLILKKQSLFVSDNNLLEVEYSFNKIHWTKYNSNIDISFLDDGNNILYIKAKDGGGNITIKEFSFIKDTHKPDIGEIILNFNNNELDTKGNSSIELYNLPIEESNLDIYSYEINSIESSIGISNVFDGAISSYKTISIDNLKEGEYEFIIYAFDKSGNSNSKKINFIIDRTPPLTEGIILSLSHNNRLYNKDDVSGFNGLKMNYSGAEITIDNPRYKFLVTKAQPDLIQSLSDSIELFTSESKILFTQGNGLYYVYTFLIDDAGNISENYVYRQIRFNSSAILAPTISGVKEYKTLTDVINYNDPSFKLTPAVEKSGDIKAVGFKYKLLKGFNDLTQSEVSSGEVLTSEDYFSYINFKNLDDNEPGEYYTFYVSSKSNTSRYSEYTNAYKFRIDTTPPEYLLLKSSSHRDSDTSYSYNYVSFNWHNPWDKTGVEYYRYSTSFDGINFIPGDISNIKVVGDMQLLDIKLSDDFIKGSLFLHVESIDYAGNINSKNTNRLEVKIDRTIPNVSFTSIDNNPQTLSSKLTWESSSDTDTHLISIIKDGYEIKTSLLGSDRSFTFNGLEKKQLYKVKIYAYSGATNSLIGMDSIEFRVEDNTNTMFVPNSEDFTVQFNGFRVDGEINSIIEESTGLLYLPGNISSVEDVKLKDLNFNISREFEKGINDENNFNTIISGFLINPGLNSFITIDKHIGLSLKNRILELNINNNESIDIPWDNINILSGTTLDLEATQTGITPFKFNSTNRGIDSWSIFNITNLSLIDSSLVLNRGFINFTEFENLDISNINSNLGGVLEVENAFVSSDRTFISGDIKDSFFMTFNSGYDEMIIKVTKSKLIEDLVVIERAQILLDTGVNVFNSSGEIIDIIISDLRIDQNGNVIKNPFLLETIYLKQNESCSFKVDSIDFLNNNLKLNGSVIFSGIEVKDSDFFGLKLTSSGVDDNSTGYLKSNFSFISKSGFPIYANVSDVRLTSKGFLLESATLDLSSFDSGLSTTIINTVVDFNYKDILVPGVNIPGDSIDINSELNVTRLEISNESLLAKSSNYNLPDFFQTKYLQIESMVMKIDTLTNRGSFEKAIISEIREPLVLKNGYILDFKDGYYENHILNIPEANIQLPENSSLNRLEINNIKIDQSGIIYDPLPKSIIYKKNGWLFNINNPYLNIDGLKGDTVLEFPINGLKQEIFLDSFVLKNNGTYIIPKTLNTSSIIDLSGFKAVVSGITISDIDTINSIKFDSTKISRRDKTIEVELLDLIFSSDGSTLNSGSSVVPNIFISNNGFEVTPKDVEYRNNKLYLNGQIKLPGFLGSKTSIDIDDYTIELTPTWNIITKNIQHSHILNFNGVNVQIENYFIYEKGLFIEDSYILLDNSQTLLIKNCLLSADTKIISGGAIDEINSSLNVGGWPMVVEDAFYTVDGITLKSHVLLPEELGSPTLYFDDMKLYKDASNINFTTNTTINSLEFDFNDIGFSFDTIKLTENDISILNGEIKLPDNDILGGEIITIKYFKIGKDGSFKLSGSRVDPITIYGFDIFIDNLSFNEDILSLSGELQFPIDFYIGELTGKIVTIDLFEYDFNSENLIFDIELDNISVELSQGWITEFSSLSLSNSGFLIGEGDLKFPSNWLENISIEECGFKDLSFDFNSGEFDIKEIFINDINVDCEGYEFTITSANYSGSDGFSFSGEFPLTGLFQGEDTPPVIIVNNLQIQNDFTIKELNAGLEGSQLSFTPNKELLYTGYIGIIASENNFLLDLSGILEIGENFELEDLRGDKILIDSFTFDILNRKIITLNASLNLTTKEFLDTTINDFLFALDYDNNLDNFTFRLEGDIILPSSFPGIGGEVFSLIGEFDSLGNVHELKSTITLESDRPLLGDLTLKSGSKIYIDPIIETKSDVSTLVGMEFSLLDSSIEFSNNFSIEKLRGSSININELIINTDAGFSSCDLVFNTPNNMELYGDIYLEDGSISLESLYGDDLITTITGSLRLPDTVGGILVDITEFSVNTDGQVVIDAGASNISGDIIDQVNLTNGLVNINNGSDRGGLNINISGDFKLLSSYLPTEIKNTFLTGSLLLSTKNGIENFYIGLESGEPINYEILRGVNLALDGLSISDKGIESLVSLNIDSGFYGLQSSSKTQGSILMSWDGDILESDLMINNLSLRYANMGCDIKNMQISENGLYFESAILQLPQSLGGQKLGIQDGGIDSSGEFYGDFVLEVLNIDILGCYVSLSNPELDKEKNEIRCESAKFILPEALGSGSVNLDDVTIGKNGLNIKGGEFSLPDINTGAMVFSNMGATLIIDGDDYEIGAKGKVFIAGTGEVEAKISLVNISNPEYPIGLKYAYFSFEAEIGGIPLANTGLMLTGVRGGLAFGPPGDDLPEYLRDKFTDGMRIQLGVTIKDLSMTVTGRSDFWLNVTNLDFALKGELEFLQGLFKSYATALYTQSYGVELKAGLEISLIDKIILDGVIRAHIFEEEHKAKFCAEATVDLSVQKLLWGFPESPLNLGTVGVEVGDFKENRQGFKGYITLNIIGTKGFYYGTNGDFKLGNVNSYTLLDKSITNSRSQNLASSISKRYGLVTEQSNLKDSNRERIIFCLNFSEGDPHIRAISPSGVRYSEGDDNVIVERLTDKILMAVVNPENGNWDLEVNNLTKDSDYSVEAIGFDKNPSIYLESPVFSMEHSTDNFIVKGKYNVYTPESTISIYLSTQRGIYNGMEVASFSPNKDGLFSYELNTLEFDNGEYFIYAGIYDGINPELYDYANGSIIVNNDLDQIPAIDDLIVGTTEENVVNISFSNKAGKKVKGYYLNTFNLETKENESLNIGNMTSVSLSSLNKSQRYSISVTPYDNRGILGLESNIVEIDYNQPISLSNDFNIKSDNIKLEIGSSLKHSIEVSPINYIKSGKASDYAELKVVDIPKFLTYKLKNKRIELDDINSFYLDFLCSDSFYDINDDGIEKEVFTLPGDYNITVKVRNIGNNIEKTILIPISISYKNPKIYNISPTTWLIEDGSVVELKGDGFTKESLVYIDDKLCEIINQSSSSLTAIIPGIHKDNKGEISITNPNSLPGIYSPILKRPFYKIENIKQRSVIEKAGSGWLYSRIKAYNNFDELIDFKLIDYPNNWDINIKEPITIDSNFIMKVSVPPETKNGVYDIKVESDNNITLYKVEVIDKDIKPYISNLSSFSGDWGDQIIIYGYGFNSNTELFYRGKSVEIINQLEDTILFKIPYGVQDGTITLQDGSMVSNAAEFQIKGSSFNIYPSKDSYQLLKEDSFKQKVFIRGYADYIDIQVESDSNEILATLNRTFVEPNGEVELSVKLSDSITPGLYRVKITGSGLNSKKSEIINITVGDNIEFTSRELKTGVVDTEYSETLRVKNSLNDFKFYLTKNSYLPNGLYLNSETGEIYGTPTEIGIFGFSVKVIETEYRYSIKDFLITVVDSGWFNIEAPEGNNRFSNSLSPGEENIIWRSNRLEHLNYLLSSKENIYCISQSRIDVLNKNTGRSLYIITGDFLEVELKEDYIFTIENRYLQKYNTTGNITEKVLDDSYLVVYNANNGFEISTQKGVSDIRFSDSFNDEILTNDVISTSDGLYKVHDNIIEKYIDRTFIDVAYSENPIDFFTTYQNEPIVLDNFGIYRELGSDNSVNTGINNGKVAVGSEFSIVYNSNRIIIINRKDMTLIEKIKDVKELILTKDKLLILNKYGISSFNLYTGNEIWSLSGDFTNLITSGTKLYVIDSLNRVVCLGGRSNIKPPVTELKLTPLKPNGNNGFYTIEPELNFKVTDQESYGNTTYKLNEKWLEFDKGKVLSDGEYNIKYRSYDTYGLKENEKQSCLKVDTIKPITEMKKTLYDTSIIYELNASDEYSEIDNIYYSLDGITSIYNEPIIINNEGNYTFCWWSIDRAGNIEVEKKDNTILDLYPPSVNYELFKDDELLNIAFYGVDSLSGLDRIEYKINSNNIKKYIDPIELQYGNIYNIFYRGIDKSGKESEWIEITISPSNINSTNLAHYINNSKKETIPDLFIGINPELPDGNNGYYKTKPKVDFNQTLGSYSLDNINWIEYTKAFILPDGEFVLTHSLLDDLLLNVKVDTIKPETKIIRTTLESGLLFQLEGEDFNSLIESTYYSLNGEESKYLNPILLQKEGEYSFEYWSIDKAGNIEDKKIISGILDLKKPKVEAQISKDGKVHLSANDNISGVNRIEYRINGSKIKTYKNPISNKTPYYNITFRAVDNVNHESEWKNIVIDNIDAPNKELINSLTGGYFIKDENNKTNLPSYLLNSKLLKKHSESESIKFKTDVALDVYLLISSKEEINNTWSLVETNVVGLDIYHKVVDKGMDVFIDEYAELIILKKNPKEDLIIFCPGESENWCAATEIENEVSRSWFYKIEEDSWVKIGDFFSGEINLPELEHGTKYQLKVEVKYISPISDNRVDTIIKTKVYSIVKSKGENV